MPTVTNHQMPAEGFLRLSQILGNPKAVPAIPPIVPVKKSCWWSGVASGRFPKPIKLGTGRSAFWRVSDIRRLVEDGGWSE